MDLFWPLLMLRWLHLWSLLVLFGLTWLTSAGDFLGVG